MSHTGLILLLLSSQKDSQGNPPFLFAWLGAAVFWLLDHEGVIYTPVNS